MKKFLLICLLLLSVKVHSACQIDTIVESICTLSDYGNQSQMRFLHNENSMNTKPEQNHPHTIPDLTPLNSVPDNKNKQFQYDSLCQFGVCLQDLNNTNNNNQ